MAGHGSSIELQNAYFLVPPSELTSVLLSLGSCLTILLLLGLLARLFLRHRLADSWATDEFLVLVGIILVTVCFSINCYLLKDRPIETPLDQSASGGILVTIWTTEWLKEVTTIFTKLPIFLFCTQSLRRIKQLRIWSAAAALASVIIWGALSICRLATSSPKAGRSWQSAFEMPTASQGLIYELVSSSLDLFSTLNILAILSLGIAQVDFDDACRPGLIAAAITACFSLVASTASLSSFILAKTRLSLSFAQAGIVSNILDSQIILLSACMPALVAIFQPVLLRIGLAGGRRPSIRSLLTKNHQSPDHTPNEPCHSLRNLDIDRRVSNDNWSPRWDHLPPPPRIWTGASGRHSQSLDTELNSLGRQHIFGRGHYHQDQLWSDAHCSHSSPLRNDAFSLKPHHPLFSNPFRPPLRSTSSRSSLISWSSRLGTAQSSQTTHNATLGGRILVETDITVEELRIEPRDVTSRAV